MAEKRLSYTSPMPMRLAVDTRHSATALRLIMAVAWHDRMSLMTGTGAGCTASNKTLAYEIGCDYTTLIKMRKHCVETGYFLLEPRLGGKRLEVIRIIPDHLADPKCWPFDQSFIGEGCLKAWHARERKVGEMANNSAEEVDDLANDDDGKVGEPISETRRNLPETDPQYIPLRGGTYSSKEGGRDSTEVAHFSQSACDEIPASRLEISSASTIHREDLREPVIFAASILGSQAALAKRSGVLAAYISLARQGQPIPAPSAMKLAAECEIVIDQHAEHAPAKLFGRFGYYLPANFETSPTPAQLALLEKAFKEAAGTSDLHYAKQSICDFLAEVFGDEHDDSSDHRAMRMESDLTHGAYD